MHAHQPEEMRGETRAPIREVNLQTPHKLGTKVVAPHPAVSLRMRDKLGQPCGLPVKIEIKRRSCVAYLTRGLRPSHSDSWSWWYATARLQHPEALLFPLGEEGGKSTAAQPGWRTRTDDQSEHSPVDFSPIRFKERGRRTPRTP